MNVGDVNYYTHSSKTKCVFVDNKELPLISIDIWCKAGSSFEEVDKNGTAHFLEHMIFKGSKKIMPGEFDYKIESLGGLSNASTGYDDVHYHVLVPPTNFRESLALLTNIVVSPNFNPDEFIKEKGVVIDEIKQLNDQPEEKLFNYKKYFEETIKDKKINIIYLNYYDLLNSTELSNLIFCNINITNSFEFNNYIFVNESDYSHKNYKPKKSKIRKAENFLKDLNSLKANDFVAHVDHGVGIYRSLNI